MGLTDDDVREILRIIDDSELSELRVETDGFSLHVRKRRAEASVAPEPAKPPTDDERELADEAEHLLEAELVTVAAPMLGVFYRAGAPGSMSFVDVGTTVGPQTTVCIIEVMKMMNSIPAGVSGTIAEVCVENATLVELGEPLFRVRPEG